MTRKYSQCWSKSNLDKRLLFAVEKRLRIITLFSTEGDAIHGPLLYPSGQFTFGLSLFGLLKHLDCPKGHHQFWYDLVRLIKTACNDDVARQ